MQIFSHDDVFIPGLELMPPNSTDILRFMNFGIPKTIWPFGLTNKPDVRFIRPISITCETGSDSSLL